MWGLGTDWPCDVSQCLPYLFQFGTFAEDFIVFPDGIWYVDLLVIFKNWYIYIYFFFFFWGGDAFKKQRLASCGSWASNLGLSIEGRVGQRCFGALAQISYLVSPVPKVGLKERILREEREEPMVSKLGFDLKIRHPWNEKSKWGSDFLWCGRYDCDPLCGEWPRHHYFHSGLFVRTGGSSGCWEMFLISSTHHVATSVFTSNLQSNGS